MTHTLHPEIEKILDAITLDYFLQSGEAGKKIDYKQRMKDKIVKHLGPYIHMPTDLKDEPLPEEKLLGEDYPTNGDRGCKMYGYIKDKSVYITRVAYIDLPKDESKKSKKRGSDGK